ncbi:MAG TPA: DUF4824 family protein, partial [Gemmatimonadales bacterium]|nr:DUF4824 family protein [Gemmatimonadales bacterium]
MNRGVTLLVALVVVANGVPLTQAEFDRAGAPRQTLVLAQNDLMVGFKGDENTAVTLTWNWSTPPELDSLTRAQLDSLGIPCRGTDYECADRAPRRGWMVVALDTVPWQRRVDSTRRLLDSVAPFVRTDTLARRIHGEARSGLDQLIHYQGRLVLLAIGTDPEALAARWGDRPTLVLRARLTAFRTTYPRPGDSTAEPLFRLHADPLPPLLYVPPGTTPPLDDPMAQGTRRYE